MNSVTWVGLAFALAVHGVHASEQGTNDPLRLACDMAAHQTLLQAAASDTPIEARAIWLSEDLLRWPGVAADGQFRLQHSAQAQSRPDEAVVHGEDAALELEIVSEPLTAELAQRFVWVGDGVVLRARAADRSRIGELLRGQVWLTRADRDGHVQQVSAIQHAALLDALYADAAEGLELGVQVDAQRTQFALWAPTARSVALCVYADGNSAAGAVHAMRRDAVTGAWSARVDADLSGRYYTYLVDVFVPAVGLVRNRVTDPYAISLTTNSMRAYIGDLDAAALKPVGWDGAPRPSAALAAVDQVIYELHLRDFSINDTSVDGAHRGKYLAFTESDSRGMRHLRALAQAGITDVHLLPVFDFATVPESGCVTPRIRGGADREAPQAAIAATKANDCFNWGYDPLHFNAPEGSYASDAADGATRIVEFRQMVQALHAAGLRVGMDVVYNHMSASGQDTRSVLDRIVPGYYTDSMRRVVSRHRPAARTLRPSSA